MALYKPFTYLVFGLYTHHSQKWKLLTWECSDLLMLHQLLLYVLEERAFQIFLHDLAWTEIGPLSLPWPGFLLHVSTRRPVQYLPHGNRWKVHAYKRTNLRRWIKFVHFTFIYPIQILTCEALKNMTMETNCNAQTALKFKIIQLLWWW